MSSSSRPLNICTIHVRTDLLDSFRSQGHTVLGLAPKSAGLDLPAALEKAGFEPDMVLQMEQLGQRTLLSGLSKINCPKAFWSIDTHLNLFWHRWYGQLFDVVLTTQRAWIKRLEHGGIGRASWLPWFGTARPLVPHPRRKRDIAFVGRVTQHRPVRLWFSEFLRRHYGVELVSGLSYGQMMELYADSRIVPNETIFGEVNFRLFEGASCGCAVLNPAVSEEIADLFEPGVEVELFEHVAGLDALLRQHVEDPMRSMKMGVAAWQRVQREHLPEHRAARILALVPEAKQTAASGRAARKAFCLSMFSLWEAGRMDVEEGYLHGLLSELGDDPDALCARLRAFACSNRDAELEVLATDLLRAEYPAHVRLYVACSAAGLRLDRWDMAKLFWYRYAEQQGGDVPRRPDTPAQLLRLWARALQRAGEVMRVGFVFDEARHLPTTASDCLLAALYVDGEDLRTYRRLAQLTADVHGAEPACMGFLSHLALHEPKSWRISLDLAMTHLRAFRLHEGMAELACAQEKAEQAGEIDRFLRVLAARDSNGALLKSLAD